jgi:uncharacterized membrane protein YesL
MKAFVVMGRVVKATYDELFLCIVMSLLWWASILLVVTAGPATMGLNHVANRIANYRRVDMSFFWDGAKRNIGRGWLILALILVVVGGLLFNIWFYSNAQDWSRAMSFFWTWILLFFLMIAQYFFPLLWQQEEPTVVLALKNAFLLGLRHPLYSLFMLAFAFLLIALSILLTVPVLLLMPAMVGLAANFGLAGLLQEMGMAPEPPPKPPK